MRNAGLDESQARIKIAPKSLKMVIASMKLKDAYSLEEKVSPT